MAFATPIRNMLEAIGVSPHYHTKNKDLIIPHLPGEQTARSLMQTLGTEWGRNMVDQNIWCATAIELMRVAMERNDVFVDDCRFPNESYAIEQMGGVVVRIVRPNQIETDAHESERHWANLPFDYELVNDGSIQGLYEKWEALGI
jgi:hypothetical protein